MYLSHLVVAKPTNKLRLKQTIPSGPVRWRTLFFMLFLRNPNPSPAWAESVLPRWQPVQSSEALPTYLELSPALVHRQGLSQRSCSFWSYLGPRLTGPTGDCTCPALSHKTLFCPLPFFYCSCSTVSLFHRLSSCYAVSLLNLLFSLQVSRGRSLSDLLWPLISLLQHHPANHRLRKTPTVKQGASQLLASRFTLTQTAKNKT